MAEPSRKKAKLDEDNSVSQKLTGCAYSIYAAAHNNDIVENIDFDVYEDTVYFKHIEFTSPSKERILYRVSQAHKFALTKQTIERLPATLRFGKADSLHFRGIGDLEAVVQTVFSKTVLHLWDPASLVKNWAPKCPACKGTHVTGDGWATVTRQLVGDGAEDVWIHTKAAACQRSDCKARFQLSDPEVMKQLPIDVQQLFPGVLTRQSGLTWGLVDWLSILPPGGSSFSSICNAVNERAHNTHKRLQLAHAAASLRKLGKSVMPEQDEPLAEGSSKKLKQATLDQFCPPVAAAVAPSITSSSSFNATGGSTAGGSTAGGSSGSGGGHGDTRHGTSGSGKQVSFPEFEDPLYSGSSLNVQYAIKSFIAAVEPETKLADKHMRSLPSEILRIDGAFKNAKKVRTAEGEPAFRETTTVMNQEGMIVAAYLGGGGMMELEDPLRRLALRNSRLDGEVRAVYVDNSHTTGKLLARVFPGMPPGGVKEDLHHVERRLTDTLPSVHGLKVSFIMDVAAALRVRNEADVVLARAKNWPISDTTCRSTVPAPDVLLERFNRVVAKYERQTDASTGERLMTKETVEAIERIRTHITEGRLSDPPGVDMYINVERDPNKPPKWHSKRGTSALEGFHRHWHELLPSFNTSTELASILMYLFLGRWNRKKSFKHGGKFYGTYSYSLLNHNNMAYGALGWGVPYPDAKVPEPVVEERMLAEWSTLVPLPGPSGSAAGAVVAEPKLVYQLVQAANLGAASELAYLLESSCHRSWAAPLVQVLEQAVKSTERLHVLGQAMEQFKEHGWWLPANLKLPQEVAAHVQRGVCIEGLPLQLMLGNQESVYLGRPQVMNGAIVPISPAVEAAAAAATAVWTCAGAAQPLVPVAKARSSPLAPLGQAAMGVGGSVAAAGGGSSVGGGGDGGGPGQWQPGHAAAEAAAAEAAAALLPPDRRSLGPQLAQQQPHVQQAWPQPMAPLGHAAMGVGGSVAAAGGGSSVGGGGGGGGPGQWQPSHAAMSIAAAAGGGLPMLGLMPLSSLHQGGLVAGGGGGGGGAGGGGRGGHAHVVSKGPNRLSAYRKRGRSGSSRRLTVADTMRSVTTSEEISLYWELYPAFTKGTTTDWTGMTREWNVRVLTSTIAAPDKGFANIYPKREHHLRAYEKEACRLVSERDSLALMQRVGLRPHFAPSAEAAVAAAMANVFSAPLAVLPTRQAAGHNAAQQVEDSQERASQQGSEDHDEDEGAVDEVESGEDEEDGDGTAAAAAATPASGFGFLRGLRGAGHSVKINKGSRARGTQLQGGRGSGRGGSKVFKGCRKCGYYSGKPKSECLMKDGHRAKCPYKDKPDPPKGWKFTKFD